MATPSRDEELLRHLDATPPAWVVTRTRRLARDLTIRVASLRAGSGRVVADTPPVRALDDWLDLLGRDVVAREVRAASTGQGAGRVLLPASAELLLWERTILSSTGDLPRQLLDVAALAATAADAWQRVCLWGEPPWAGPLAQDVEAFRTWLPAFRRQLADGAFVTSAELPGLVAEAFRDGALEDLRPATLIVLGFEKADPAILRLVDALRGRGTTVLEQLGAPTPRAATPRAWSTPTRAAEVRTVASRIRERLLESPDLRVAVLAADLSAYGTRLERVFEEELDPAGVLAIGASPGRRFDYAEAPALADYPLVGSALDLLQLGFGPVPFEAASRILLAEYPRRGDGDDRVSRGAVEASLRRSRAAVLALAGRRGSLAAEARRGGLVAFASKLEALSAHLDADRGTRRSPSAWRREWIRRLEILGWPGPLHGDAEGLVFRRWREALDEFAMLEVVEAGMDSVRALSRLAQICSRSRVQPSSAGLGVQVMNLLDAAGLEFDVVFAIGLTSTAFPAAPKPNPLLPAAWQRVQPGMPRASVEGERELADALWSGVLASAPEVFASYATMGDGDEESTPSAVLAGLAIDEAAASEGEPWWLRSALAGTPREARPPDVAGPPLVRRGGSSIVTNQSGCAFRAFAAARLGAGKLDEIQPQPDASRRGTLVHAALATAYRAIPTSDDLAGLSDGNIVDVARDAARAAVHEHESFFEDADDLAAAARTWLEEMVAAWMTHERDVRVGAWSIDSLEEDREWTFADVASGDPLVIRFRPDRVDRVEEDGVAILDFKTSGTPKGPGLWRGDRPTDPQLPLYLVAFEDEGRRVDGIAFANLSARDACLLAGSGADEYSDKFSPPGRKGKRGPDDYLADVAAMRVAVTRLASAYLAGDTAVDPKDAKTCKFCGCQVLCRVGEGGGGPDDEDSDAGDDA